LVLALSGCAGSTEPGSETESTGRVGQALTRTLPGRIEAEAFDRFSDSDTAHNGNCGSGPVDQETTTDPTGGTCNVGWTAAGEWLEYDFSVAAATKLDFSTRVASAQANQTFHLNVDGVNVTGSLTAPSGGWQTWENRLVKNVAVGAGSHVLRIAFDTGNINVNYFDITASAPVGVTLPAHIEAENYNRYLENTPANLGGACDRADGVDKEVTSDPTGGGCDVGWTDPGEWLEYDVNVPTAGNYDIRARLASANSGESVRISLDGNLLGGLNSPAAGWQAFDTETLFDIPFSAGNHVLRITFFTGLVNLNYLDVTANGGTVSCTDGIKNQNETDVDCGGVCAKCAAGKLCEVNADCSTALCSAGTCVVQGPPVAIPARIEAEAYARYYDTTVGNTGGACGTTGNVDKELTTDPNGGVCDVGWTAAGEYLEYDISSTTTATYNVTLRLASLNTGMTVHLELDSVVLANSTTVSAPGLGWQTWQDRTVPLAVSAGSHILRVVFDTGNVNINYLNFVVATTGVDSDNDGLPDSVETNTGHFVNNTNTGTDPHNADTDGDGIKDGDEVLGTSSGLNLPAMGASPVHKNIFLEFDWFDDSIGCGAHSHRPTAAAIAKVTAAFANGPVSNPDGTTGVKLISDYGQGGAFTGGNFISDADGVVADGVFGTDYLNYRAANFAANRQNYFHYVLMPHFYNTDSTSSGQAAIVGDSLIVSLYCANSDDNVANTIMHELGHNLGLLHGGFEDVNYKPNYNSVMNYAFQFSGVDTDCIPGGNGLLDYSRNQRISLDENALHESAGICGSPAYDWNFNGTIDANAIQLDINSDSQLGLLSDNNDWASLVYNWHGSSGAGLSLLAVPRVADCTNRPPGF